MCDNADGTQWFHFLNEEFTERRLQGSVFVSMEFCSLTLRLFDTELVDEFLSVSIDKETMLLQQRFDQMQRGLVRRTNFFAKGTFTSRLYLKKPTSSNENSVRHSPSKEPTLTDSLALRETNDENETRLDHLSTGPTETRQLSERTNSIESTNHCHVKASLANREIVHRIVVDWLFCLVSIAESSVDCSPLKSSARPIPTVMSSIASQQLVNVHGFRHQSRIMPGTFCYAASPNAFHHYFRPQYGSISTQNLQNSQFYRTDVYIPPLNFYSQCQTPIIEYNLAERVNKRYSEPPSAPIKRIKQSFNVNPPYWELRCTEQNTDTLLLPFVIADRRLSLVFPLFDHIFTLFRSQNVFKRDVNKSNHWKLSEVSIEPRFNYSRKIQLS